MCSIFVSVYLKNTLQKKVFEGKIWSEEKNN